MHFKLAKEFLLLLAAAASPQQMAPRRCHSVIVIFAEKLFGKHLLKPGSIGLLVNTFWETIKLLILRRTSVKNPSPSSPHVNL